MATDKKQAAEKPLDKMTVKELREIAKEIPEITGVHGMNKEDLLAAVKQAKGIAPPPKKKSDATIREIKQKIKDLKAEREAAIKDNDKKKATIYRRRISRLKKKTRSQAA